MIDKSHKVTGGCLCGAVRYEAEALLSNAYYCHCTQCQKSSGAPFEIGVPIREGTLKFSGTALQFFSSSEFGRRGFCSVCGSRIVWTSAHPDYQWATNVSACSLDHPEDVRTNMHVFVDTQLPWFSVSDDLPRYRAEDMDRINAEWKKDWQA
jgi:hypothetical protein